MTLLLAATTLLAVSCGKDNTEPEANGGGSAGGTATPAITESSIMGTWGYKSTHALTGNELVIKGDHTAIFDGKTYNWTLTDNQFVANAGNYFKIEFTINAINEKSMDISGGAKRYNGSSQEWYTEKNMTGTVVKTVTEVLSSLMTLLWVIGCFPALLEAYGRCKCQTTIPAFGITTIPAIGIPRDRSLRLVVQATSRVLK